LGYSSGWLTCVQSADDFAVVSIMTAYNIGKDGQSSLGGSKYIAITQLYLDDTDVQTFRIQDHLNGFICFQIELYFYTPMIYYICLCLCGMSLSQEIPQNNDGVNGISSHCRNRLIAMSN